MKKTCIEFPGREFKTTEEMFSCLKQNEERLVGLKKSKVYKSCEKGQISFLNVDTEKASGSVKASVSFDPANIYPVISTTKYMDSHMDVHFDGCFNKTKKEQQGKVHYALDHELKWNSIVAWPKDVKMFTAMLDWGLVGKNYPGQTEGLIFEIPKDKIEIKSVLDAIEARKSEFENSIRMVYYKIKFAANSNQKDLRENKQYFDERIDLIANKDVAMESGYFWGVEELGIHKEGSLVVAGGSNDATSIIIAEEEESNKQIKGTRPDGSSKANKFYHLI